MKWCSLVYGWLCCCAAVVAISQPAYACEYGTHFSIDDVHANGLVHLKWHCLTTYCDKAVPDPLRVADAATMTDVPGSLVWVHGERTQTVEVFWKASEPLVAGKTYRVLDLEWATNSTAETFTVLPAATWTPTEELELKTEVETVEDRSAGEISCPARYPINRCGPSALPSPQQATVYTRFQTSLWLSAYAIHTTAGKMPPLKRRMVYWRDGDAPVGVASAPWSLTDRREQFTQGAERYCYRTQLQNLLDGSERAWEGCVDHGNLPELTTREASRVEIAPDTEKCTEPPAGYEDEWCGQSTLACGREFRPSTLDCEYVAKRCAALAEDDDAGTPEDDAGEPRKPRKRTSSDSGCTVSFEPNGDSSPLLLFVTALAVIVLRRRKR